MGKGGGGLNFFSRKRGKEKWGVAIILRFFWRFLKMQHEKSWCVIFPLLTNMCYKIIASTKYEMISIVIVLIVLIVIIAVLIIHANNKHSA